MVDEFNINIFEVENSKRWRFSKWTPPENDFDQVVLHKCYFGANLDWLSELYCEKCKRKPSIEFIERVRNWYEVQV